MSWFSEHFQITSEKNGLIDCRCSLGEWEINVKGYGETAPYLHTMWQQAFTLLPEKSEIKNILIIGYGAGGNVAQLHKTFPDCKITAIEWDPVMVEIADYIKLHPNKLRPEILIGDAAEILQELSGPFDLILFDAYSGNVVMPEIRTETFCEDISRLLGRNGFLLYNWSDQPDVLDILQKYMEMSSEWTKYYNRIALFQNKKSNP